MELKKCPNFSFGQFSGKKSWYYTNGFFLGGRQKIVLFHRKDSFFRDEIYENRHSFLDMKLSKITFSLHFFIHWICLLIRRTCLWYKKWHTFFWLTSPIQTRKSSSGLWGKLQSLDFFQEVSHKQLKQNGKCMKNWKNNVWYWLTLTCSTLRGLLQPTRKSSLIYVLRSDSSSISKTSSKSISISS